MSPRPVRGRVWRAPERGGCSHNGGGGFAHPSHHEEESVGRVFGAPPKRGLSLHFVISLFVF